MTGSRARRLAIVPLLLGLAAGCAAPPAHTPREGADGGSGAAQTPRSGPGAESGAAPLPPRAPGGERLDAWVEIERPGPGPPPVVHAPWIEVAGSTGVRGHESYDVVIAIDVSGSTRYASGADVNGNGVVGVRERVPPWRAFEPRYDCSDPGDSVLDAERVATRRLVERLDPERTRIGLVSFSDVARPRAPIGSTHELLGLVLDDLAGAFGAGATDLAAAARLATRMLVEDRGNASTAPAPDAVVLILSDGYPTHPDAARASDAALAAAREARAAGVRISSFALGIDSPRDPDVFAEMARESGGEHLRVATPGDVVAALPGIDLARVADLRIDNLTTGRPARAVRVRPDGSYDGYVRLEPGENRIRVTARGESGREASGERRVVYDDSVPPDPGELERLHKRIELRTVQMELLRDARERRAGQRRVIRVEPDPDTAQ